MRFSTLVSTVLCAGLVSCSTLDDGISLVGIRTDYDPHAILSRKELRTVVKLVNQCGVPHVGEVYTYNIHPSSDFGIGVKSVETIQGRQVSFVTVNVYRKKWIPRPEGVLDPPLTQIGEFWVDRYGVSTNKLTTFSVNKSTVRVGLEESVPLDTADHILGAFAAGKVRYQDGALRNKLKGIDFSKPVSLGGRPDQNDFSILFNPYGLVDYRVGFTLDADGVTIISVRKGVY